MLSVSKYICQSLTRGAVIKVEISTQHIESNVLIRQFGGRLKIPNPRGNQV